MGMNLLKTGLYITWAVFMTILAASIWSAKLLYNGTIYLFRLKKALPKMISCPSGTCPPQPADGQRTCKCNANITGWVWDKCPACDRRAPFVPCDNCGEAIINPLADPRELQHRGRARSR